MACFANNCKQNFGERTIKCPFFGLRPKFLAFQGVMPGRETPVERCAHVGIGCLAGLYFLAVWLKITFLCAGDQ